MTSLPPPFIAKANSLARGSIAFAVVRNERVRIAPWLDHYRRIGISAFAVVDNGSTDGTFEFLSGQNDVALIRIEESYAEAQFGIDWLNDFHARLDPGHWVLFADADELLVYRGWPTQSISDLGDLALRDGRNAVFGFMLDMYPDGPVDTAYVNDGHDLFERAPCFDRDYCFRPRPKKPWESQAKSIEIVGGPRVRILSSFAKECKTNWVHYFFRGQIDRILPLVPDHLVHLVVRLVPRQMPALSKVPLVLSGSGFRYSNSHGGGPGRFYRENVVFCHFKFLPDFAARVKQEAIRQEHFRRGAEYIMYARALDQAGRLDLRYEGTKRFSGAETLIQLGLIRDIRDWIDA